MSSGRENIRNRIRFYEGAEDGNLLFVLFMAAAFLLCFDNSTFYSIFRVASMQNYARLGLAVSFLFFIKKVYAEDLCFFTFIFWIVLMTYVNNRPMWAGPAVSVGDTVFILVFLMVIAGSSRDRLLFILDVWKWMMFALLLMDYYSFIRYPNGMYFDKFDEVYWFLGYKTHRLAYYMPMMFFFAYTSYVRKKKIDIMSFVVCGLCIGGAIFCDAGGAGLTLVFCTAGMVILNMINGILKDKTATLYKVLNHRVWIPVVCALTYAITFLNYESIITFISTHTNRSPTLSNRLVVWAHDVELVREKPIFGYGFLRADDYLQMINYANAHCMLMTILLIGGVVGVALFLLYVYASFSGVEDSVEAMLITIFVYAVFLIGITSSAYVFTPYCFVPLFCLRYCKPYVIRNDPYRRLRESSTQ